MYVSAHQAIMMLGAAELRHLQRKPWHWSIVLLSNTEQMDCIQWHIQFFGLLNL